MRCCSYNLGLILLVKLGNFVELAPAARSTWAKFPNTTRTIILLPILIENNNNLYFIIFFHRNRDKFFELTKSSSTDWHDMENKQLLR